MRCPKCRAELEEDAVFCTNCGVEIETYIKWSPDYQEKPKKDLSFQSAGAAVSEKPEKTEDFEESESFFKSESEELKNFQKLEPEETERFQWSESEEFESFQTPESEEFENFQEPKLKEPKAFKEPRPKEPKAFKESKPKEPKAFKESKPKQKKLNTPSFEETFYQQKERFHAKEFFKKHFRAIAGITIILAALIFAVSLVYDIFFGPLDNVIAVYDENDNTNIIYLNTKEIGTVDGAAHIFSNMDRSAFYVIDGESTAWYLKGKKLVEVMKDCEYVIIANHDKTALLVDKENSLFRYSGSKLEKITGEEVKDIAISGNGDYYAYSVYEAGEYISYIGKKPDKEEKAENIRVSAISEKGEYVYGIGKGDDLICIDKKGKRETLGEDIYIPMFGNQVLLNEKGTEIMFVMDKKIYISVKGKEKKEVADGSIVDLYGRQTGNVSAYVYSGFMFYPVDTLKESAVSVIKSNDTNLYLISSSYEGEKIVSDISECCGTDKKVSTIYYTRGSAIYSIKAKEGAKEKKLTDDLNIREAHLLKNGKEIYFITEDSKIGCVRENGEIEYAQIKIDKRNCTVWYAAEQGLYIQAGENFFYISGENVRELKNIKNLFCDRAAGKVYAYARKQLYSIKDGKMKKLKGNFNKIYYITSE